MIEQMVEAGNALQAQEVILRKVADQVGGAGAGAGKGLAGQIDLLSENWTIFLETMATAAPATGVLREA